VEPVVASENGKFLLKNCRSKTTIRELIPAGAASHVFFVLLGERKQPLTGSTAMGKLVRANRTRLKQGELQLDMVNTNIG